MFVRMFNVFSCGATYLYLEYVRTSEGNSMIIIVNKTFVSEINL